MRFKKQNYVAVLEGIFNSGQDEYFVNETKNWINQGLITNGDLYYLKSLKRGSIITVKSIILSAQKWPLLARFIKDNVSTEKFKFSEVQTMFKKEMHEIKKDLETHNYDSTTKKINVIFDEILQLKDQPSLDEAIQNFFFLFSVEVDTQIFAENLLEGIV